MAQAIKYFNGEQIGTGNKYDDIYTCPANTIAIVLPFITMRNTDQCQLKISFSTSTPMNNQGDGDHNLQASLYSTNKAFSLSHQDKQVYLPYSTDSAIYCWYAPHAVSTMGESTGIIEQIPYLAGRPSTRMFDGQGPITLGTWVMTASDKLVMYSNNGARVNYSFMIIEEAA